jgi:hypothetical protein
MKKIILTILMCISAAAFARITYNIPYVSIIPDFDGQISAGEWDDALAVSVSYEDFVTNGIGSSIFGTTPTNADISGTYYFKWDESYLYMAFDVTDNVLIYQRYHPGSYNGQDTAQIAFNPYDNPAAVYEQDAWMLDITAETLDSYGADIYRHTGAIDVDPNMISSTVETDGYVIEIAIEWSALKPGLDGKAGDAHGLGILLADYDTSSPTNLLCDFGDGANVINQPAQWNKMVLVGADGCGSWGILPGDFNLDCYVDLQDIAILASQWLQCTDPENTNCNI